MSHPVTPAQRDLNRAIRAAILRDGRIGYALAYGSFTQGTADAFSDLEYYVFLSPADLPGFGVRAWLEAVAPVRQFVVNDFGTPNAVMDGLIRVELHAEPDTALPGVEAWPNENMNPAAMLVKDRGGRLAAHLAALAAKEGPHPEAEAQLLHDRLLNWLVFGVNVLERGERVRALEVLGWVRGGLLRLARLAEGNTGHWLTASRRAEWELSAATLDRYARLTGRLDELETLYAEAWSWTQELTARVPGLRGAGPELARDLTRRLGAARQRR
ncbi:hypothetical protein QOL99_03610 [Deinococcus sp. MIMF12]|uniref:Lincosamide nucleotidyltransferase-like C-terminal domain-containing protein n=1 Tax=Deinococcus rhizophilus TaxID=3049544 RepID=A0ABT7JF76_9DEIO|nr:hypothetical protein [Deinococcus rhizophilus]MDL2343232.1 hypothetical protein [Deinococcus rhizophilus]